MSNNNSVSFWQSPLWADILSRTHHAQSIWHTFHHQKVLIERRKIVGKYTGLYILGVDEGLLSPAYLEDIRQKVVQKTDLFLQIEPISYGGSIQNTQYTIQSEAAKLSLIYEGAEQREGKRGCPDRAAHPLPPQNEGEKKQNSPFLEGAEQREQRRGYLENGKAPFRRFIEPVTAIIPLVDTTEEKIFQNCKEKGRYHIRVATKRGVTTKWVHGDDICPFEFSEKGHQRKKTYAEAFFDLLKETTKRDKFAHNPLSYYQTFLRVLEKNKAGGLLIAVRENTIHAAAIFVYWGEHAMYYYGASSSLPEIRRDNGTYLLQWNAIREALRRKCVDYDFLGISSHEGDALAGVTAFKMRFGPEKVIMPPEKVIVFRSMLLQILQGVKRVRKILRFL